jgi:hypothetical protein
LIRRQAKASDLMQQLKKHGPAGDWGGFADSGEGHPENPATAQGWKTQRAGQTEPKQNDDPYQKLIRMKPGEITGDQLPGSLFHTASG